MGLRHSLSCPAGLAYSLTLNAKREAKYMNRIIALLLVLAFPALPVRAEDAPPALLEAIGIQESGLNPLVVNVAGKEHYPASRISMRLPNACRAASIPSMRVVCRKLVIRFIACGEVLSRRANSAGWTF